MAESEYGIKFTADRTGNAAHNASSIIEVSF